MSEIEDKKIRLSDVANAIGRSSKVIRNWLERDQIQFFTGSSKGWRNFSYLDVAVLAIVSKLTEFGLKVEDANAIAVATVSEYPVIVEAPWTPPLALATIYTAKRLIIWRFEDQWMSSLISEGERRGPQRAGVGNTYIDMDVAGLLVSVFAKIDLTKK